MDSVGIQGGAQTVGQYLYAGLIDELRLHIAPAVLGVREPLFDSPIAITLEPLAARHTEFVTHIPYAVRNSTDAD